MNSKNLCLKSCICGVLAAAAMNAAYAQERATLLEEIVVTAQKRSENLQEVPVAITALTDQTRDLIGINSVQDMTDFTPSLVYYNGVDRMMLRGIGRLTNNAGTEPGVATYVDGFYLTSNVLVGASSLLNERVEILRGPQGTLYGRNSIGGAINTISRRPSDEWNGEVRVGVANYDRTMAEGTLSGPIGAGWKVRLTATDVSQNRGYFENIGTAPSEGGVAHNHLYDFQVQGAMGPVDLWFKYMKFQLNTTDRLGNSLVSYNTATFFPPTNLVPNPQYGYSVSNPSVNDPRVINTDTTAASVMDHEDMFIAHVTWHMSGADLKYIGGYYRYDNHLFNDFDNTSRSSYQYQPPGPGSQPVTVFSRQVFLYEEFHNYYSNELNLTSSGDGALQWIAGLYQYNEHLYEPFSLSVPEQTQLYQPVATITSFFPLTILPGGGAPNPGGNFVFEDGLLQVKSIAAFGQIDYKFTDHWKLTAGLRYSKDDKTGIASQRFISWNPATSPFALDVTPAVTGFVNPVASPAVMYVDQTTKGMSGTLGTEWAPSHDTLVYLKYSRGFKAGSLNLGGISQSNPNSTIVDPEKLDAFEVGVKQTVGNLQLNGALYYYNYRDAQVPLSVPGTGTQFVTQFVNIAKTRTYGAELEAIWQPTSQLNLIFNYSYLNAVIQESVCLQDSLDPTASRPEVNPCQTPGAPAGAQSPEGSHMLGSPPNKISAAISYKFDFSAGSLTMTATDSWRDKQYSFIIDRPYWQTPSYNVIGARLQWTDTADKYKVIAYVANLADKLAADSVAASASSTSATGFNQSFGYLAPRTYGIEVHCKFGGK